MSCKYEQCYEITEVHRQRRAQRALADRFWEKVQVNGDECWIWLGCRNPEGYGRINPGRHSSAPLPAHRVAYQLATGDDPGDDIIMHTCDNRACVNPAHLMRGTKAMNSADMVRKGRSMAGERSPSARLTDDQVLDARRRYAAGGITFQQLADEFGVSETTVRRVVKGHGWRYLPIPNPLAIMRSRRENIGLANRRKAEQR